MDAAILAAIEAAKAAAGNVPAQVGALPSAATGSAVSTRVERGNPLSMDDLLQDGGITVDAWLKVDQHGIHIGGKKPIQEEVLGLQLDLAAVRAKYSIKYSNPPIYKHTYDHQVSSEGEAWALVCQRAQQVDNKAREYRSADIPLIVTNDIPGTKGEMLAEADQTLGLTLSTTAWKYWERFFNSLAKAGVDLKSDVVTINLRYEVINRNGNTWGVPTFELVTN